MENIPGPIQIPDSVKKTLESRVGDLNAGAILIANYTDLIPFETFAYYPSESKLDIETCATYFDLLNSRSSVGEKVCDPEDVIEIMELFIRIRSKMHEIGFSSTACNHVGYYLTFSKECDVQSLEKQIGTILDDIEKLAEEFKGPVEKYIPYE